LVQAGGFTMGRMRRALANPLEMIKQIDEEIEQRIDQLIKQGDIAEDEGRRWREKLLPEDTLDADTSSLDESEIQRLLDQRGIPSNSDLETLSQQLEELMTKLEELETNSE
jgi:polyhydroxyalkanoate synthesis regulator phasin